MISEIMILTWPITRPESLERKGKIKRLFIKKQRPFRDAAKNKIKSLCKKHYSF